MPELDPDQVAYASLVVSALSLMITLAALGVAWWTLGRGNRNASAATVLTIGEYFRAGWERFWIAAALKDEEKQRYALAELLNVAELACIVVNEGTLAGESRKACQRYLEGFCADLEREVLLEDVRKLRSSTVTFSGLVRFISAPERAGRYKKLGPALASSVILNRSQVAASPLGAAG